MRTSHSSSRSGSVASTTGSRSRSKSKEKEQAARDLLDTASNEEERELKGDEDVFEVEKVLNKSFRDGIWHYYVKWVGWSEACNTWEPEENMQGAQDAIRKFEEERRKTGGSEVVVADASLDSPVDVREQEKTGEVAMDLTIGVDTSLIKQEAPSGSGPVIEKQLPPLTKKKGSNRPKAPLTTKRKLPAKSKPKKRKAICRVKERSMKNQSKNKVRGRGRPPKHYYYEVDSTSSAVRSSTEPDESWKSEAAFDPSGSQSAKPREGNSLFQSKDGGPAFPLRNGNVVAATVSTRHKEDLSGRAGTSQQSGRGVEQNEKAVAKKIAALISPRKGTQQTSQSSHRRNPLGQAERQVPAKRANQETVSASSNSLLLGSLVSKERELNTRKSESPPHLVPAVTPPHGQEPSADKLKKTGMQDSSRFVTPNLTHEMSSRVTSGQLQALAGGSSGGITTSGPGSALNSCVHQCIHYTCQCHNAIGSPPITHRSVARPGLVMKRIIFARQAEDFQNGILYLAEYIDGSRQWISAETAASSNPMVLIAYLQSLIHFTRPINLDKSSA